MATYQLQGGPFNASLIASLLIEDANGNAYNLLPYLNGDVAIVPPKQAKVRAMAREHAVATVPGQVADGSITIPILSTALVDTTGAGYSALYEALAQTGTGTSFTPFQTVTMTGFDGDTAGDVYLADSRAKMFKIILVLRAQSLGLYGQRLDVYAEIETPDPTVTNSGGTSQMQIVGAIPRRGCMSVATT